MITDRSWKLLFIYPDVVNRIRNGESIPFRPLMPDYNDFGESVVIMIRTCWSEDPEERPNFAKILKTFKSITGGT